MLEKFKRTKMTSLSSKFYEDIFFSDKKVKKNKSLGFFILMNYLNCFDISNKITLN